MCGIFGYIGTEQAAPVVRKGLKNLDYRGYDSWGVVVAHNASLDVVKRVGKITNKLPRKLVGKVGLGHTRWATHGGVIETNAHPHLSSDQTFALVHNGIVENMTALKDQLLSAGYKFESETDSEVIVRLIEHEIKVDEQLTKALQRAVLQIQGRNTVALLTADGDILAVKQGSPLVMGRSSQSGDKYLSSDTLSFADNVDQYAVVENGQLVLLSQDGIKLSDIKTKNSSQPSKQKRIVWQPLQLSNQQADLREKHYMIQEIKQTPEVLKALLNQPKLAYQQAAEFISQADKVLTIGSGTAGLAAAQIAYYLRTYAHIEATSLIGAESTSYHQFIDDKTVVIAPSQSGETADVLEVLELAREKNATVITQVNMPGSSMTRMADLSFMAEAGPEKCVMSTKIFTSQIAWGYLLAKTIVGKAEDAREKLSQTIIKIDQYLTDEHNHQLIKNLAKLLKNKRDIFLLGTGDLLNVANEGMIKLIEGTYKHAHAIAAGDLKHYAITLMEKGVPVIILTGENNSTNNAAIEVKTRGAEVITLGPQSIEIADFHLAVPTAPELQAVASILPLQLLSYYLTDMLGLPVDKPRNIAKSVTVK